MDNQSATPSAPQVNPQPQSTNPAPVPYSPQTITEPPAEQQPKQQRTPLVNGILLSGVILLVGFVAYNVVGRQLTQLAGQSTGPSSYSQIVTATPAALTPTTAVSVTPTPAITKPTP